MTKYWHAGDATVESSATANPRQRQFEDREIEVVKEHNKAGEEQEQGNVENCGHGLNGPWQETPIDTFGKERTDPRSLIWTVSRLSDPKISSCPLVYQRCKESTGKADGQAQEPKRIDPNSVVWWGEGGWERRGRSWSV